MSQSPLQDKSQPPGLSIGAVASFSDVPRVTLRYWERLGLICSLRSPGGHRYYSSEVLSVLQRIRVALREKGATAAVLANSKFGDTDIGRICSAKSDEPTEKE